MNNDLKKVPLVTKCKRLFLIFTRIILTFMFDIRAELYLEVYKFIFLLDAGMVELVDTLVLGTSILVM